MWSRALKSCSAKHQVILLDLISDTSKNLYLKRNSVFLTNIFNSNKSDSVSVERGMSPKIIKSEEDSGGRKMIQVSPSPFLLKSQSVVLPGSDRIRASALLPNSEDLLEFPDSETRVIVDVLYKGSLKNLTGKCIGSRSKSGTYEWISYDEVIKRKDYVGSGLINLGLPASQDTMVGICTRTRPEFLLTLLGAASNSMVLVPMYESIGPNSLSSIMAQVQMGTIICETVKIATLITENAERNSNLKNVILIEGSDKDIEMLKQKSELNILTFKELEELGKSNMKEQTRPNPEDLFCICYTSGTTGEPKGVMVSHQNILSCIAAMTALFGEAIPVSGTLFAYLPCAHIYEIINEIYALYCGGQLGYYSGDMDSFMTDIADVKPEVLPLVPKLMNLIYYKVKKKVQNNAWKKVVLQVALHQKQNQLKSGIISNNTAWDKLVFSEVQKALGGSLKMIICSSAPVSKDVMNFFRCASGCMVFEAYGLSEVGAAAMTMVAENDSGFVGPPLPSNLIKLASVPELNYDAADDVGEICVKGPNVFKGYYKNPEASKEALDEDGWLRTGDIGRWLPNGTLKVFDRKKHIFKLSQGEYLIPDKIENVYLQSEILFQVFVDGKQEEDFAIAVVVPDESAFVNWANSKNFKSSSFQELCENKKVKQEVLKHMIELGKSQKLSSLFQVGNIYLTDKPFSQEDGLLTPTMKLKRSEARKKFASIFDKLYKEGNLRTKLNL
ncbi:long-chain-fatty-acid--CoA ligase 5-like [Uloborus diversus]|uniref:long-chain-fatty-acid--CoA ligase 5-like n=1 Tax=Uloborus diversus TaxID=327109 RepID=UPI002409B54F|nr:long-chain-fatty-acid--CoA ligase 5-like [Uloborus diversus]